MTNVIVKTRASSLRTRVVLKPTQGVRVGEKKGYLYNDEWIDEIDTSVSNAQTWAEGTDEQVAELGGEHSARGWAEYMIEHLPTTYIHEQGTASNEWTITHNLNKYPAVSVVDSAGNEIIAEVQYVDTNTCVVRMTGATKGKAFLN